ncbi:2-keto-3-deoxygluconate permease [Desulfovibrio cuneatus]|uniref:2-keto-3-deoxygluconate permease n=1 Tax=Desulfovibrio cuneatus TaxID=159728 RepID=UPI000405BB3F|nr:2-keto-3-deoxygluconate permease [Desulfovibrio cuneatus]
MKQVPITDWLQKLPGGMMLVPLILGSLVGTFAPDFLQLGSFTTALFKNSALPLIGLLILATGAQINARQSTGVFKRCGVVLLGKTLIPALLVIVYGNIFGREGILGVSLIAAMIAFTNSNGGLWLALAGQYGNEEDRGAYIASGLNDGPFFTLLALGLSGHANVPWQAIVGTVIPFIVGFVWGNVDRKFADMMKPTAAITIPFFSFALGTGINLNNLITGGMTGILLGIAVTVVTGTLCFIGYRWFVKDSNPGIGFAAGTTAGNAVSSVIVVTQADPSFASFQGVATAQIAAAVLVTALLSPLFTHYMSKRYAKVKQGA